MNETLLKVIDLIDTRCSSLEETHNHKDSYEKKLVLESRLNELLRLKLALLETIDLPNL